MWSFIAGSHSEWIWNIFRPNSSIISMSRNGDTIHQSIHFFHQGLLHSKHSLCHIRSHLHLPYSNLLIFFMVASPCSELTKILGNMFFRHPSSHHVSFRNLKFLPSSILHSNVSSNHPSLDPHKLITILISKLWI